MDRLHGNPVVKVLVWVVSHRKVGAHDPFGGTTELDVLDAVLSTNGIWPLSVDTPMSYRHETKRLLEVEMYKVDYNMLKSPEALLGWSEYRVDIGPIVAEESEPLRNVAIAEVKA